MTERQSEILAYIRDYIYLHGYSPTLDEMKHKLNLGTISTVHEHLRRLVKQGHLKKNGYKRGYELPSTLPINSTVPDIISSIVHSTVFDGLTKHGISRVAAMDISRNVKEEVDRLLKQKGIHL